MAGLVHSTAQGELMKTLMTAALLTFGLVAIAGPQPVAAQDAKKFEKGSTVTLQGCVIQAEKKDTFVLTNVREWPVAATDMGKHGKRMYWIEKTDKMKDHAGHTIQIIAKISDVEKSEMEIKPGENGNGWNVEIEGPGKDVVAPASTAGVKMESRPNKDDIPITLLKLKIDEIKMIASTCAATY